MSQPTLFGGSNSTFTQAPATYTGLNVFKVLGINPTKEQIEEWTGSEYRLNVDYSIREVNGRRVRPVEIWLTSVDNYIKAESLRFLIGDNDDINQNGTVRYVNTVGEFCQSKVDPSENDRMGWFTKHPYRIAKQGEYELFNFMQALMRYSSRDDNANFMEDAENNGITSAALYDGDLKGLQTFIEWTTENENKIVLLCAVRKTVKSGENGAERVYYNQILVNNPEYFYRTSTNEVSARSFKSVNDALAKGRRVTNSLFTVYFQEFKEEDCLNAVPQDTVTEEGSQSQSFNNWMKK